MPGHDIIVIGASAGGVEALTQLLKDVPPDLPAAIFVVLHVPSHHTSVLPKILNRASQWPATHPSEGEIIQPGCIYVAPSDHHLLIHNSHLHLSRGPRENGHRPAIDPLFMTAARAYGPRVVGVILSGTLDDGTAGLARVKAHGGVAIVQNPDEALYADMPRSAIENVAVDHILPLTGIVPVLERLAREPVVATEAGDAMPNETDFWEAEIVKQDKAVLERGERPGEPTVLTCPDCGGVLWELEEGDLIRFRCHVGHVYSADSLLAEQSDALELALWTAVRALEEKASLARRMAARAQKYNNRYSLARFEEQAQATENHAALVRQVLNGNRPLGEETPPAPISPPGEQAKDEAGQSGGE